MQGVTRSADCVEQAEYALLRRDGKGRIDAKEATVLTDELGEWMSDGMLLLSGPVEARFKRGR